MDDHDTDLSDLLSALLDDDLLLCTLLVADELGARGLLDGEYGPAAARLLGERLCCEGLPPWAFYIQ